MPLKMGVLKLNERCHYIYKKKKKKLLASYSSVHIQKFQIENFDRIKTSLDKI